jgi:SAM-dependent methyltransferase
VIYMTAMRLAMFVVLHAFGLTAGWAQEPAAPAIDEEIAKQEQIYRSPAGNVPSGYITSRALSDYVALLPSGFCATLAGLGSADRWLDIGAGKGDAILDYYQLTKCRKPGVNAYTVAMSIEDRRTAAWIKQEASLGEHRMRYLTGKRLRHYALDELGKFQMINVVFGGFSYTEELSQFVERVLDLLETGGVFYTMLQGVHLESGKEPVDTAYQTELLNSAGGDVKVCSWLRNISCVRVECESNSEWAPTEMIRIHKVCGGVSVPPTRLLKFEAGNPPGRKFQLER